MRKEKSKVFFDLLLAHAGLALVFCIVFQAVASSCQNKVNYSMMHFFMRMENADAENELANATIIKDFIRMSVLSRPDIQGDPRHLAAADSYFRLLAGGTNVLAGCFRRSDKWQEGMRRFGDEIETFSKREKFFSAAADITLIIAMVLNIFAIGYGWKIHDLYRT